MFCGISVRGESMGSKFRGDLYTRYVLMLCDPANIEMTPQEFALKLGVGTSTIYHWARKKIDWNAINEQRREAYGRVMVTVDSALLKKAQKGDTEAIKLFYTRFDGYVPVSGTIDLTAKTDDELKKRADEIKGEIIRDRIGQDKPGDGTAGAG